MTDEKRIFTLKEAQELLPEVREITAAAACRAEELAERLEALGDDPSREAVEVEYQSVLHDWASRILDLGVDVKGLWLVDFDSGDGIYYCWQHPEEKLEYFHDYDSGFAGRRSLGRMLVS